MRDDGEDSVSHQDDEEKMRRIERTVEMEAKFTMSRGAWNCSQAMINRNKSSDAVPGR